MSLRRYLFLRLTFGGEEQGPVQSDYLSQLPLPTGWKVSYDAKSWQCDPFLIEVLKTVRDYSKAIVACQCSNTPQTLLG
jgi:hypothetical protein